MRIKMWSLLVVVVLTAAACRGASEPTGDVTSPTTSVAAVFPRTVKSLTGDITIDEQPERVITLGFGPTDVVVGLGNTPVGAFTNSDEDPFGTHVPLQAYEDEIPSIGNFEINLEEIAAQRPDLIVALSWIEGFKGFDEMKKIAPVLVLDASANWTEWTEDIGYAMGLEAEATEILDTYRAHADEVAASIPDGTEVALVTPNEDGSAEIQGPDGAAGSIALDAGLDVLTVPDGAVDWNGEEGGDVVWTTLSKERFDEITSESMIVLTFLPNKFDEAQSDPLWNELPAFANDAVYVEEGGEAWFQPGPLGATYALDQIQGFYGS
jgi:iron complex transport system substrate-binding protein